MTDKCTSPEGHKYEPEYNITIWIESWRCVYCKQLASTEKIKVSLNEHAPLTEMVRDAYKACYSENMECPWCFGHIGHNNERHEDDCPWRVKYDRR